MLSAKKKKMFIEIRFYILNDNQLRKSFDFLDVKHRRSKVAIDIMKGSSPPAFITSVP